MNTEGQTPLIVSAIPAGQGGDTPFFYSPELAQRLDLLRHLTESSDLIPLVKGPEGSGKSTLIEQIITRATENWLLCHIEATPMLQPEQLFTQLASAFTASIGSGDALELLGQRFTDLRREGHLPVIIIDDAHLLPEMSIITLLQLYTRLPEDRPMVRLLLFAQPEIDAMLESPQIQSMGLSMLQVLDMPLLKREQTTAYIEHILAAADSSRSLRLSLAQCDKIYTESGGLPGRVEQLVLESMRSGIIQWGAARLSSVSPLTTVASIIGVVALLLILIFQDSINSLFAEPEEVEPQVELLAEGTVPLALPPTSEVELPELATTPTELATTPSPPAVPPEPPVVILTENEPTVLDGQVDAVTEQQTEPVAAVELPVSGVVEEPSPEEVVEVELEQQKPPAPTDEQATAGPVEAEEVAAPVEVAVIEEAEVAEEVAAPVEVPVVEEAAPVEVPVVEEVKVAPEGAAPVEEATPVGPAMVEESSATPPQEVAPTPQVEPAAATPAPVKDATPPKAKVEKQAPTTGVKQEAWLLQQRPGDYTLQLVGVQNAQGIPSFITRHSLNGQAAYFRTSHQGHPWFVVLYGVYPNRSAALKARATLPSGLRNTGVWPRSFGSVQKEILNR